MKRCLEWLLLGSLWLLSGLAVAEVPAGWKQIAHGGLLFSVPADWGALKEREFEGQWGIRDDEKRQGVGFVISRDRHPGRNLERAGKEGMEVTALGQVPVGELSGEQHQISGQIEGSDAYLRVTIINGLLADGDRISFTASVIGMPAEQWQPILEQVMSSVSAAPELVATLQGYARHTLFDGLISVETRNNWEMTDHSDDVSWEPPLVSLYGAQMIRFARGYAFTGRNGLLSKMDKPTVEKSEMFGIPAWKIVGTGVGITYTTPMRTESVPATTLLYLSDICLAKGDRFGYAITASEAQLSEHQAELDKLLTSVQLQLPEQAGPCDELVTYDWVRGLQVRVPRSWRPDQNTQFQLSWYDKVLTTGADVSAYVAHNTTDVHPVTGYGHPAETLEQLSVDGYPATHFRKTVTGSDKVASTYDYYVLDTRMRYLGENRSNSPTFLIFKFSTSPAELAEPDTAMHKQVLESVVFSPEWESETPMVRVEAPVSTVRPAEDKPVSPAVVVEREAEPDTAAEEVPPEPASATEQDQARQRYEKARKLREEGALLQQQGELSEAVEKYRSSLSLYPDERLEAHIRRIEQTLSDAGQQ